MEPHSETSQLLSLAEKVASVLRDQIRQGEYAAGERLQNERELSRRFEVSRGTVRQALKLLESERLVIRQQGRGTFVCGPAYAPVRGNKASLIAAMVYEKEYYFGGVLSAASSQAATRGYMLTTGSNMTEELESRHLEAFINSGVCGVVLVPKVEHSQKAYDRLVAENIPVVLLDTTVTDREEDFVRVDNQQGIYLATRHLIDLGHRRIGYIGHARPENVAGQWDRLSGFLKTCKQAGIDVPEDWRMQITDDDFQPALRTILRQQDGPTAIVAYNDIWAVRVIRTARDMGIRVPEDLSVTGFDDSALARNYDIPVTSVHPEPSELGAAAVDLLIEKIEKPRTRPKRSILILPHLEVRQSTAAAPE